MHSCADTLRRSAFPGPRGRGGDLDQSSLDFHSNALLRGHDDTPEVINAGPAAHHPSEYREFDGIMVPTRRRVYRRGEDGTVNKDMELVTIDVESVVFV
ncbi:hypothetical protein GFH48_01020 [Streptomyces fagopyri]|uniref:Uncharacterized protein n=1 Tax=Streptomyces fagopyri TaxID=2662397 RepID=A0A5Q0L4U9_9ACTN|nr:hypothetical protein [Streptomyces fagopyri]QFZ72040.1 hypothetical protein GFH48_01020 [Streptomyces fagopyri]